jgi:hypothetical protein
MRPRHTVHPEHKKTRNLRVFLFRPNSIYGVKLQQFEFLLQQYAYLHWRRFDSSQFR